MNKLLDLQKEYFLENKEKQELFDVFNVKAWKKRMPIGEEKKVAKLANLLHIPNSNKLHQDWPPFRMQLIEANILCPSKADLVNSPEKLWTYILNSDTLQKTLEITNLLRNILVIPTGSASVERIVLNFT